MIQCVTTLTCNVHVLLFLEQYNDWPAAVQYLKKIKSFKILSTLFVLRDLLDPVEILSQCFQRDDFVAFDIEARLQTAISKLRLTFEGEKISLSACPHLKTFVSSCSQSGVWLPFDGIKIQLALRRFKLNTLHSLAKSLSAFLQAQQST